MLQNIIPHLDSGLGNALTAPDTLWGSLQGIWGKDKITPRCQKPRTSL